jgi:hypothetical protein
MNKNKKITNKHLGQTLDEYLAEKGILEKIDAAVTKRIKAGQFAVIKKINIKNYLKKEKKDKDIDLALSRWKKFNLQEKKINKNKKVTNKHIGPTLDEYLAEKGVLEQKEAAATKRIKAGQFPVVKKINSKSSSKKKKKVKAKTSKTKADDLSTNILEHASNPLR